MSYDQKQAKATRVVCSVCGQAWYMVKPKPVCFECRGGNAPPKDVVQATRDVNGYVIWPDP